MILLARTADLTKCGRECQDIVANDVLFAVVLMERPILDSIDDIVFQQNSRASLICVEPPSTVGVGKNVVNSIVSQGCSGRIAEAVDPPISLSCPYPRWWMRLNSI